MTKSHDNDRPSKDDGPKVPPPPKRKASTEDSSSEIQDVVEKKKTARAPQVWQIIRFLSASFFATKANHLEGKLTFVR